eukprot:TRINITY_DN11567_c0_g1_i1.p1 TRINITY_DN11567_c0_g1~~TRINITY_DN11567_c0_g1_i1.p1  ORF type:complete len:142 (+),score=42.86 TRINITY_DN11567_c0_g1_i1:195-620(+)
MRLCFAVKSQDIPDKKEAARPDGGCSKVQEEKLCLSYYNDKGKFECVDKDTSVDKSSQKNSEVVCGYTPHLSSFAILLSADSSTSCADNKVYFYTAIGLIGLTVICICFVLLAEWRIMLVKKLFIGPRAFKAYDFRRNIRT